MTPNAPKQKWGSYPLLRDTWDSWNFNNLELVGKVPTSSHLKDDDISYYRSMSKFSNYYGPFKQPLVDKAGEGYYIVRPIKANVDETLRSWDQKLDTTYENKPSFKLATQFLDKYYGVLCHDNVASVEEVCEYVDYNKSPGYPGNYWNINSKLELVRDVGYLKWWKENSYDFDPYYTISPKKEYQPIDDIRMKKDGGRQKIRLFTIPPYHLLFEQLRFGKRISLRLKQYKWSAYGFNPYRGGVNALANRLLTKRVRFFYDVSGWDKFLPLMKSVFDFVERNSDVNSYPPHIKRAYDWMKRHSTEYLVKLYDGSVFRKKYGNASGSGTTTRDNILAHIIIVAAFLIEAYHIKNGCYPSYSDLDSQIVQLFGDDSIMAVDEDYDYVLHDGFLEGFFKSLGMKLKFLHGGYDYPLEKMQFLGFTFRKIRGCYYPLFDTTRLATTMLYDGVDSLGREAFISRSFVLYFMSYSSDDHIIFRQSYENLLKEYRRFGDLSVAEDTFVTLGLLSETDMEQIYQGLESSYLSSVFNFFSDPMEEEGFKNFSQNVCK